ncbi:hypothetical protein [Agarilytica rhodophyticola]|uniref:hypothetical protein n=1 Tax=Agarilytica rhodophyticola TaxID=1737490 RepID=UPI000B3416AF|nr:hypothetical protein [Agarilytica rhodophyticola]
MYKKSLSLFLIGVSLFLGSTLANALNLNQFPQKVKSGNFYLLKKDGKCADIPTNQQTGKMLQQNVIAWNCGNKQWQKWIKISNNEYQNAFHKQCRFKNSGLNCSGSNSGGSNSGGISTNTDCISYSNNFFRLNKAKALRNNGKACTAQTCNNPNRNYLAACQKYVHADCFIVNGQRNVTGFHKGLSEGGTTNNHFWSNIDPVKLNGLKKGDNNVAMYDKQNCTGWLGQFNANVK